jgi:L-amino acid N-acyltransferase YncA
MHRKNGFELVGIQREIGRVDGVWRDVAIMQCLLDRT